MPVEEEKCVSNETGRVDDETVRLTCAMKLSSLNRPNSQASITRRTAARLPTVVRLLVLAHQIDEVLAAGRVESYAEVAMQLGISRARLSQIMKLLTLAPDIQERILTADASILSFLTERTLRPVLRHADWSHQRKHFTELLLSSSLSQR